MLSSCVGIFLLASTCIANAHVLILPSVSSKVLVTSSLKSSSGVGADGKHSTQSHPNLLSLEDAVAVRSDSASVVQDWSLVCKQLCGVGLGGAMCAPCATASLPQPEHYADDILQIRRELICKDLCTLQLGGAVCKCNHTAPTAATTTTVNRNVVCQTFCDHSGRTVPGCSLCMTPIIVNENVKKREMDITALDDNSPPNWSELCAELCKTGDGGSLCNCDLSPFIRLIN